MSEINWKNKYQALKAKFMDSVDMAFRLGYEQGQKEAQTEAVVQQQQQEAEAMAAQANGMTEDPNAEEGMEQEGGEQPQEQAPDSANPAGSELDKHINELESMLSKGEVAPSDLLKAINGFRSIQKSWTLQAELKKSAQAIPAIAKALHKPKFKIGKQAQHNMTDNAKKAVTMQEKIVTDIMKSWEEEEKKAGKDILSVLNVEGLTKKTE